MWQRLIALVKKELLVILRDPKSRVLLIGPPLMQLILFSYAATLDVTNVDIAVLNRDGGRWSNEFISRVQGAPAFHSILPLRDVAGIRDAIDTHKVIAAVHFGPDFSRNLEAGLPADIQIILDGRRSNASQIVNGYLDQIANSVNAEVAGRLNARTPVDAVIERFWFNPSLEFIWFTVPNLVGTIALLIALMVTGQSVARERELGTHEQLMVSPLRVHEILMGKTIPPLLVGLFHSTLFVLAAVFLFGVPLRGSLILLYASLFVYLVSIVGVGLFISSLAQTQQQAFLGVFLFAAPAILLSGFATPIDNMPDWLQTFTMINPLRHFLVIIKGVFLTAMPAGELLHHAIPLVAIATFTLAGAALFFRRRIG
jgi:ABC-2 type transport system permease protein